MLAKVRLILASHLLLIPVGVFAADFPITVFLTRHAEKADAPANDPVLTSAGTNRANKLATMLGDKKVTAIYVSEFSRTRLTAKPLSERIHVAINDKFSGGKTQELAQAILGGKDRVVLVVGHSNTVPAVITALGAGSIPAIKETEFDNIYIVTVSGPGKATVIRQNY